MMFARLLSGPRAIARDLIDKRLWPVALALLVAIVVIPVVLGRSSDDAAVTPAAVPAAPAQPGADTAIKVSAPAVLGHSRPGDVDDPFYSPSQPVDASAASTTSSTSTSVPATSSTTTTPSTSGGSGGSGSGSGSGSGGESPSPSTQAPPAPTEQRTYSFYRPRVRFGADENAAVSGLSRLESLGDSANPAALYLGPTANHTRAVFLLAPNAVVTTGEADCGETTCRIVALKAGQSITLGVIGASGYVEQSYVLTVDEMHEQKVGSEDELMTLRDRIADGGRDVLREMIKDRTTAAAVGKVTYDRGLGAVVLVETL
jgi:hypothetical protein